MDTNGNFLSEGKTSHTPHRKLEFESDESDFVLGECNEKELPECGNFVCSNEKTELIHSGVRKETIPIIGMEFEEEEEAFKFYNDYAYTVGFSIRRSKYHKKKDGKFRDRLFVCSCEGKRGIDKRDIDVKSHRPETRCECLARMKISCVGSEKYRVIEFISEHNHVTSTPSKSHLHRSHRKMTLAQIEVANMADSSGIPPKATLEFMSRQAGGRQNLGFIPVDYQNYLRSKRTREMVNGDTGGVLEYLQRMQLDDPNFFYAIQVDANDLITNIFWADAKMMVDYSYFGDVVCFDTTYRKNKEGRPFAMFVGVNHHKQTLIFGAALLYDETAETFVWLFNTFVKAMSGKKPKTILTDQDAAMAKALGSEWPETCHRLCIWHIYQNAAKHLSSVFENFKDFAKDFSCCIYDYEDEDDFVFAWNDMLKKYSLKDNDWLKQMFEQKNKWALVYGRETFCADITTTQRSESMNSAIKKYVSYKHDLLRFFEHFQRLVEDRRYEELKADFKATQSLPYLSFPVAILKHASSFYTPKVLKEFQNELCKAHDCDMDILSEIGTMINYKVTSHGKHFYHTVKFNVLDGAIECSCKKFEFAGWLCAHVLKVLSARNVKSIPNQYILKRWTKNVKANSIRVCYDATIGNDPKAEMGKRYKELCRLYIQLATRAAESEESYKIATLGLKKSLEEVDASLKGKKNSEINQVSQIVNTSPPENPVVNNGDSSKVKGIKKKPKVVGKSSRPKNALEKAIKKKRPRTSATSSSCVNSSCVPATHSALLPMPQFELGPNMNSYNSTKNFTIEQNSLHRVLPHPQMVRAMDFPTQPSIGQFPVQHSRGHIPYNFMQQSHLSQNHHAGAYNVRNDQHNSNNMVSLLQAQLPSGGSERFAWLNSQPVNTQNSHNRADMEDV